MKSRISFFNGTVVKKNITRFAPVWGLYTVFLLLGLFTMGQNGYSALLARDIWRCMSRMAIVNLGYGGICAVMLLGDLFQPKLCNALHAFPLRREGWLCGHIVSGLLFSLVPNALITVLGAILLLDYAYMAPIWFAVVLLQFLFFFGTGVLSAVCAGNRLAMVAVYGIIHFITVLVYAVVALLYLPLLYGIELDFTLFSRFFPLYQMVEADYVIFAYFPTSITGYYSGFEPGAWSYLLWCAGAGVVMLGLSFLVYRKRALETAGDFISLRPIAPVFLVIFTIGVGCIFYLISDVVGRDVVGGRSYFYLAVGLLIGFFAGRMLLKRTLKVFTKRAFAGFGVLVIILAGSVFLTWLDPLGLTTRLPKAEEIAWGAIYTPDEDFRYREGGMETKHTITDPAELMEFQQLHAALAKGSGEKTGALLCNVRVEYALKDGSRFIRYYKVDVESELGQQVKMYFSDPLYLFQVNSMDVIYDQFTHCNIECYDYTYSMVDGSIGSFAIVEEETVRGLLEAIAADCATGAMAQPYAYHSGEANLYSLEFVFNGNYTDVDRYYGINVNENCVNTVAFLQKIVEARKDG